MIRTRTINAKTGRPFSLSMRGRYRLADLCQWLEIGEETQAVIAHTLLTWPVSRKATIAGSHVLVTGENFLWAINQPSLSAYGGQGR
jgi:hypothetical protein